MPKQTKKKDEFIVTDGIRHNALVPEDQNTIANLLWLDQWSQYYPDTARPLLLTRQELQMLRKLVSSRKIHRDTTYERMLDGVSKKMAYCDKDKQT